MVPPTAPAPIVANTPAPIVANYKPDAHDAGRDLFKQRKGESARHPSEANDERSCEETAHVSRQKLGDEEGGKSQATLPA